MPTLSVSTPDTPVASPCVDICRLDAQGLCVGCRRTIGEITEWSRASDARRREILSELARRRS
ncbi:MAG: DUF1289 domain-containing protein [Gammaproteobacteria bacterium]